MPAAIPTSEPSSVVAGDTLQWLITGYASDYPASGGWVLAYTLVNAAQRYTITASASGDDWLVTVAAATSGNYAAGDYEWRATVSKAGEVYTIRRGRITVEPAFTSAVDARSPARRTLEAIEATIEGRASSAVAEYQIAGRALKNIPIPELLALRDRYASIVAQEDAATQAAAGLAPRGRVMVRF